MKWRVSERFGRWKEVLGRYQTILLVVVVGLVLMLLPTSTGKAQTEDPQDSAVSDSFDLEAFEKKLAAVLSQVEGAGDTEVVLTLKSSSRQILAQDVERDGERTSTSAVTVGGSSQQTVVPLQTIAPQFQGAVVVCPGGDNPEVRLQLIQAVSALTGLGSDRISICKRT